MNKTDDWFKIKGYPHIGMPIYRKDETWVKDYVSNRINIERHRFLPFIHKTIKVRRFRKEYSPDGELLNNGLRVADEKTRPIHYASHLDSCIFGYYASLLSPIYKSILLDQGINECVTAYRKIPLNPDKENSRNKCNIDFAEDVFEFIRNDSRNHICAIAFDIKGFFDNLDHKHLKQMWAKVLGESQLPKDHYQVYKNITKYSYVFENELFELCKNQIIIETKSKIRKKKAVSKSKYLMNQRAIAFCSKKDFIRLKRRKKGLVKANKYTDKTKSKLRYKGIPQGSPISSILANMYLLEFDKKINNLIAQNNGVFRRYSDDIVIICSIENKKEIIDFVTSEIKKEKLEIQSRKTQIFHFVKKGDTFQCFNETPSGNLNQNKKFEYLGFEFNGEFTYLKSSSIASYYRKMKRTLHRGTFYAKYIKNDELKGEIFRKRLYLKYSYKGAERRRIYKMVSNDPVKWLRTEKYDWGNYISYANMASRIMNKNKIKHQTRNHWRILNDLITTKENTLTKRSE